MERQDLNVRPACGDPYMDLIGEINPPGDIELTLAEEMKGVVENEPLEEYSHLDALTLRLYREKERLANAKNKKEKELRAVWIAQIEREIQAEKDFIGWIDDDISDEDLLASLGL